MENREFVTEMKGPDPKSGTPMSGEKPQESTAKSSPTTKSSFSLRQMTVAGLLSAVTVTMGVTGVGLIPIPPINATIMHIPTLLGAILEGPRVGMFVGFVFGVYSLIQNMMAPNIMSFAFVNPFVSVLPRLLFGPIAYLLYKMIPLKNSGVRIFLATALGTVMHTIMVMSMIFFLYGQHYAESQHISEASVAKVLAGVGIVHGIPEALLGALVVTPIVLIMQKNMKNKK